MRAIGIPRQITLLIGSFLLVTVAALAGMSWLLNRTNATNGALFADSGSRNAALFALIDSAFEIQKAAQLLVREKDPDVIEKMIADSKMVAENSRAALARQGAGAGQVGEAFEGLLTVNAEVTRTLLTGDYARSQEIMTERFDPAFHALLAAVGKVREQAGSAIDAEQKDVASANARRQALIYALVAAAVLGLLALAVIMVRHIGRSLRHAAGSLSESAGQMAAAAAELASTAQSLAEGANEQSATLQETASSTDAVRAITRQNTTSSQSAAALMGQTTQVVDEANQKLEQLIVSMHEINGSSDKISKIIHVIDEIAFQTNILALNAAVEAARAGAAGMSFAVVADEVRNLAQRCAQAARDTTGLIEESKRRSVEGRERLDQVSEAFQSITTSAGKTKDLVASVDASTREQASGIEDISRTVAQMERVTQKTAASSEESAAAAEQLAAQSQSLRATVRTLSVLVDGARA